MNTIKYEQGYCKTFDITIIIKWTLNEMGDIISQEISGFYFGQPTAEDLEKYKNKGTILNFK